MKTVLRVLVFFLVSVFSFAQSHVIQNGDRYYFSNKVVVKLKENNGALKKSSNQFLEKFSMEKIKSTFSISDEGNEFAKELNKIFTLSFNTIYDPEYISKKISKLPEVEWAEPHYLFELALEPNDPKFLDGTQKYLERIKAKEAWDINTGSEDIIIAIVDTGVDWDHPDLANNIWVNEDELASDGVDNDNNGFIDDVRGWDFGGVSGTADNNPNEDKPDHGTHVAGIASAVTNNGIGVSSIGFNSKIMAVKTSQNNIRSDNGLALIAYGYNGIVYAADNGAKIINCSWGGYSYSIANQEVIDYATSKGALVIGAAGNDNKDDLFYPASYDGVLSVAATNSNNDQRASFSNYGNSVDVAAPGASIYSTWSNDTYANKTGTSMSSPLTAGLAALVVNEFPSYTPLQIAEQIRVNADNIDSINLGFINKLGLGRINALNSLTNKNSKSVRLNNATLTDAGNNDEIYESGEEVIIEINCTNYLLPTSNLQVTLETSSSNISITNGSFTVGSVTTLGVFNNSSNKFKIKINENAQSNIDENLLITFTDGAKIGFDWISLNINPTYRTQHSGNLALTITSDGAIGFDDYPNNLKGDGLTFEDGENVLFEGALMYGTSANNIVNTARNSNGGNSDNDFTAETPFTISVPGTFADEEGVTIFNERNNVLGISTKLNTYSFSNSPNDDYVILNYNFQNTTSKEIDSFFVGLFCDFDLGAKADNDFVGYNTTNNFAYVFDNDVESVSPNFAVALLNNESYNFFAIDNPTNIYDGFSDEEKWSFISNGVANNFSTASDISLVISGGPYTIPVNNSITVAFAVAASDSLNELENIILQSRNNYNQIPTSIDEDKTKLPTAFKLSQNFPNPFNPTTTIKYSIPEVEQNFSSITNTTLTIYDILGRTVATLVNENKSAGDYEVMLDASNLTSGVYYYQLKSGYFVETKKLIYLK
ncbi:MAG: S8 family serine peptidase [Melioribacteraceae bacterium]